MESLLCESESEIAKRWASTGVEVPFRGEQRIVEMRQQRLLTGVEEVGGQAGSAGFDPPQFEALDSPQDSEDGKYGDVKEENVDRLAMEPMDERNSMRLRNVADGQKKKNIRHHNLKIDEFRRREEKKAEDEPSTVDYSPVDTREFDDEHTGYPCTAVVPVSADPWKFWGVPKKPQKEMLAIEDVQAPRSESEQAAIMTASQITALNCASIESL